MDFLNADMDGTDGLSVDDVVEAALLKCDTQFTHQMSRTDYWTLRNMLRIAARAGYEQGYENGAKNREEAFNGI